MDAAVDAVAVDEDESVAEALQTYLATQSASYLVIGRQGDGQESKGSPEAPDDEQKVSIGRVAAAMLRSPRCAICLCP